MYIYLKRGVGRDMMTNEYQLQFISSMAYNLYHNKHYVHDMIGILHDQSTNIVQNGGHVMGDIRH